MPNAIIFSVFFFAFVFEAFSLRQCVVNSPKTYEKHQIHVRLWILNILIVFSLALAFFPCIYVCVCAISMFEMEMTVWQQQQQRGIPRFFDDLTDYVNMQRDGFRERTTQK